MKHSIYYFLFFTLAIGCSEGSRGLSFEQSPEAVVERAEGMDYLYPLYEILDSTTNRPEQFLLVDLRRPVDFERGHLPNAVNIPVARLLDPEPYELLRNSPKIVLYGSELSEANGPWFLLTQLGLPQVSMLEFGYREIYETGTAYAPEDPHYDFAAVFRKATERHQQELEAGKAKPVVVPPKKTIIPKKKKKKDEEEGC